MTITGTQNNRSQTQVIAKMQLISQLKLKIMKQSLFDTGATISCMSKTCFDKLDPKAPLITQCTQRVNYAVGNSLGPLGTTTCTLRVSQKFSATVHSL